MIINLNSHGVGVLTSVADPDSLDPDPALKVNPDPVRIQVLYDQKLEKIQLGNCLLKGRLSYRRSLQPSKENIQHFKK
jgi:hypothetical protein